MRALEVCNRSNEFASGSVDDLDAGIMGNVETVSGVIAQQVVPTTLATDLPPVGNVIGLRPGDRRNRENSRDDRSLI
jgi:hypothetical protein